MKMNEMTEKEIQRLMHAVAKDLKLYRTQEEITDEDEQA